MSTTTIKDFQIIYEDSRSIIISYNNFESSITISKLDLESLSKDKIVFKDQENKTSWITPKQKRHEEMCFLSGTN